MKRKGNDWKIPPFAYIGVLVVELHEDYFVTAEHLNIETLFPIEFYIEPLVAERLPMFVAAKNK